MTQIKNVIPHVPSKNIDETIAFLLGLFNFEVQRHSVSYAEMKLDGIVLGILSAHGEPNEQSLYLCVDNVEELWEKIEPKLEGIRFKAPFDQEYGMREIHIIIPHTNTLLFIGHPVHE